VNPTLIWSEDELSLLKGSNLQAATYSLRAKLEVKEGGGGGGGGDGGMASYLDSFCQML